MNNKLKIFCPRCQGQSVKKNGIKGYDKQNWLCKSCGRQFIGDHQISYPGCASRADQTIQLMLARCCGIRDIAAITGYSKDKIQGALKRFNRDLHPAKLHYDRLEVDEFWTFVGNKKNKVWLLYAYERKSGEMVAYVWGRRDIKTVMKLKEKIKSLGITYDCIATDDWRSFLQVFGNENHEVGKRHTVGIEGNNCRLRHRIKRAVRKTCCFSKKLFYHLQAFALGFLYINHNHV